MATRYIAIDPGKFSCKIAEYDAKNDGIKKCSIRSKVSEGDFRDDAIEKNTVIVEIDSKVYKVGNGARGTGANLDTDKKSEIHKICVLTALAAYASANETDEFYVAVGLPAKEWANVSKRCDYKDYILPDGEVTVSIKKNSSSAVQKKTFVIKQKYILPESISALFMDQTIENVSDTSITGVIDIGNLNLNATLWQGVELCEDKSTTAELGGAILIQELTQEISTNIVACDDMITANILKMSSDERSLPPSPALSEEQITESKELIKRVIKEHATKVKRTCRARNWSLDITNIVAIGGTSKDIEDALKEEFGGNITVLQDSTFCNVYGYLRIMCSKIPEISKIIPLEEISKEKK